VEKVRNGVKEEIQRRKSAEKGVVDWHSFFYGEKGP